VGLFKYFLLEPSFGSKFWNWCAFSGTMIFAKVAFLTILCLQLEVFDLP